MKGNWHSEQKKHNKSRYGCAINAKRLTTKNCASTLTDRSLATVSFKFTFSSLTLAQSERRFPKWMRRQRTSTNTFSLWEHRLHTADMAFSSRCERVPVYAPLRVYAHQSVVISRFCLVFVWFFTICLLIQMWQRLLTQRSALYYRKRKTKRTSKVQQRKYNCFTVFCTRIARLAVKRGLLAHYVSIHLQFLFDFSLEQTAGILDRIK